MSGLLRSYAGKMTGRSRAQVTRLIGRYLEHSEVKESSQRRHRFQSRFTAADLALLAEVDEAHETMSGPATKRILEREWTLYQNAAYKQLATISIAHIYNLRKRRRCRECRLNYTATRAVQVAIGERGKPEPGGQPGSIEPIDFFQGTTQNQRKGAWRCASPTSALQAHFHFRNAHYGDREETSETLDAAVSNRRLSATSALH